MIPTPPKKKAAEELGVGDRVVMINMRSEPQYNNTLGTIESWNTELERWRIRSELDGGLKALRPDKFEHYVDPDEVKVYND